MNDTAHVTGAQGPPEGDFRDQGSWRVFPFEGAFEFAYSDVAGNPSIRRILARELKVGPGKVLLGGIDIADDRYRGFRADRIHFLVDDDTGERVGRNIVDWLIGEAQRQLKERRRARAAMPAEA